MLRTILVVYTRKKEVMKPKEGRIAETEALLANLKVLTLTKKAADEAASIQHSLNL